MLFQFFEKVNKQCGEKSENKIAEIFHDHNVYQHIHKQVISMTKPKIFQSTSIKKSLMYQLNKAFNFCQVSNTKILKKELFEHNFTRPTILYCAINHIIIFVIAISIS